MAAYSAINRQFVLGTLQLRNNGDSHMVK